MDPIHPIIPVPPNIPPVTPAPLIGRIDREDRRRSPDDEQRHGKKSSPDPTAADYAVDERDGDEDSGLHVNVTA
jgi:hypothetical protein